MASASRISLKPISRVPLTEVVADRILSLIQEGQLKTGDKLPSQKELGDMLKVSRPSLREALSGLVMLGYIEARAGQGYYVRKTQLDQKPDYSSLLGTSGDDPVRYLYEARSAVEPKIAEIAALRATEEDITRLYDLIHEIEKLLPSTEALEKGLSFHLLVAEAARNPILLQIENTLLTTFSEQVPLIFSEPPSIERDVVTHLTIIERIEAHDPEGARRVALEHLRLFAKEIGVEDICF